MRSEGQSAVYETIQTKENRRVTGGTGVTRASIKYPRISQLPFQATILSVLVHAAQTAKAIYFPIAISPVVRFSTYPR